MNTSTSRPVWRSEVVVATNGVPVDLPENEALSPVLHGLSFYTHSNNDPVEVRRFMIAANATLRLRDGSCCEPEVHMYDGDERVAIGCAADVDAFVVRLELPGQDRLLNLDCAGLRTIRTRRFADILRHECPLLDEMGVNVFQRDWLCMVYLAALVDVALSRDVELAEACLLLETGDDGQMLLKQAFGSIYTASKETDQQQHTERQEELIALLESDEVLAMLTGNATVLWEALDAKCIPWMLDIWRSTVASSFHQTVCCLCPEADTSDITVELNALRVEKGRPMEQEVWFTEASVGGGGAVDGVLDAYGEDPCRFLRLASAMLDVSELELVEHDLKVFLAALRDNDDKLRDLVARLRAADSLQNTQEAWSEIVKYLPHIGVSVDRSFLRALNARVLRPGSSPATDCVLYDIVQRLESAELQLGVEIDSRVWSHHAAHAFGDELLGALGLGSRSMAWIASTIYGMLPSRGERARNAGLDVYNPFECAPQPERLLVRAFLPDTIRSIDWVDENSRVQFEKVLVEDGRARIRILSTSVATIGDVVADISVAAVECGSFKFFPRLTRCFREGAGLAMEWRIMEYWR